ncbi:MAG: uracil-DNA glycosylase family protein [Patescibacteria group bacterium]
MALNYTQELKKIKEEVLNLKESPLFVYRTENKYLPVVGEGNHQAGIMLVGEAPGLNEAKSGRPFCGSAGKLLDELLEGAGLQRSAVYITNILKDRPPANRDPLPQEMVIYTPFLDRQIDIIEPKIIVGLGRFSSHYLLKKFGFEAEAQMTIGNIQGKLFKISELSKTKVIIPMYHPAAAIYNRKLLTELSQGFKKINKYYTELIK